MNPPESDSHFLIFISEQVHPCQWVLRHDGSHCASLIIHRDIVNSLRTPFLLQCAIAIPLQCDFFDTNNVYKCCKSEKIADLTSIFSAFLNTEFINGLYPDGFKHAGTMMTGAAAWDKSGLTSRDDRRSV